MAEKKPKIGPRETQLREMREARASAPGGKTKRRATAKAILKFAAKKRSGRGR